MKTTSILAIVSLGFACSGVAKAESNGQYEQPSPQDNGYQPPRGEQPTYGKKYYPTEPMGNPSERDRNFFLEINPALLAMRGIGLETEVRIKENLTLGADFLYTSANDSKGSDDAKAKYSTYFAGIAPKIRFYPMEYLGGVFFGAKLIIGQASWKIESNVRDISGDKINTEDNQFLFAPTAHVGYRFTTFGGFTLAAYAGGGVNIPKPDVKDSLSNAEKAQLKAQPNALTNWEDAEDKIDDQYRFRYDFGLTLGVFL